MKYFKHIIVTALCLLMLFPLVFVFVGASHDSSWAFNSTLNLAWGGNFIKNLLNLINNYNVFWIFFVSFSSSVILSIVSIVIIGLAAYAFCKYEFKGKKVLWSMFIALVLIPQPAYLIGQLEIINSLKMYSTFMGLIVPFIINLRVLIYLQSVSVYVPNEVMDAARIDGASEFRIMLKVSFPLMKDKLILAFFLIFIASWNNFLVPMIITSDSSLFTLPILTSIIADPMQYDIGAVFMSLLFSIVPVTILFLLFQKRIFKEV